MTTCQIGILGAMGRMGQAIAATISATEGATIGGAADRPTHDMVGKPYPFADVTLGGSIEDLFRSSDVVIDFTPPGSTAHHAGIAAQTGKPLIVGTTGLKAADHAALDDAAASTVIVQAGNFSLGVNLLTALTQKAASILGDDWDIEILEMHHRNKVDAPSGTAEMLGEAAASGRQVNLEDVACRSREGIIGARPSGEIGFATLRGGSVIGEHEVVFASDSERITLSHRAENRGLFAGGAVRAAVWAQGKPAGRYTMLDVLGLDL
ncbi:4-hydroxy-tetrahydrodipicolinate reductase [Kordiimonas sediminis]|uniref:4-hydroxy-tetrahydrodipicolinate reductase n=1 Tax=Kordiimonas sediminis TaxID=1735581 RepID=A0A919AM89_9PROT|nr:4-hydroxy-tetrahydrodipicolinate reductase [Kordiimonas sediminis]GHF15425.1 4-hydroxy-tetrahydrodipicolinate reductase [Kordiimonas sediminis]